jgi:intron-binding protein aquarius
LGANECTDIILSLTRTSRPGYMRDARRLTVALSRARLGLYVLGRRVTFERVAEVREAFAGLFARPTDLALVTGEMWPATRLADPVGDDDEGEEEDAGEEKEDQGEVQSVVMAGVEHLGQYVFEMTKAKVQMLKETGGKLPALPEVGVESDEEEGGIVEEEDDDGSEEDEE